MESESKEKLQEVSSNIDNVEETMVELGDTSGEEEEEGDDEYIYPKRDDGSSPDYEVPGVEKVVLDGETQTNLGIVVGQDVTGEHPWKKISKELIIDNINAMMNDSPFAPLKKQIVAYEEDEILVGYLLDETNDCDEFYVCLTIPAKEYCETVAEEFLQKQAQNLDESVVKQCQEWKALGTEEELDQTIVKNSRPLIRVEIKSKFPVMNQTDRFAPRNATDVRDGYIELIPVKAVTDNLFIKRIDAQIQVTPVKVTSSAQTVPRFPRNIWTQCATDGKESLAEDKAEENSDEPPVELSDHEKHKREVAAKLAEKERELTVLRFRDFLFENVPKVERLMNFNSTVDIYNLDYPSLVLNKELCKVENMDLRELIVFSDKRTKNKYVSSVTWHPLHTQLVAVSYVDSIPSVTSYTTHQGDEVKSAIYGENPVLVWSVFDSLRPRYYFESNSEVSVLSLCIFDEDLVIGGCANGQIVLWDAKVLGEEDATEVLTDVQESNRLTLYSGMTWMKKIHDRFVVRTTVSSDIANSHNSLVTDISWVSSHYEFDNFGKLIKLPAEAPRSKQFISSSADGTLLIWDLKIPENVLVKEKGKTKHGIEIPKVLIFEKSPYKVLKGAFKPIFRIITGSIETRRFEPLVWMTMQFPLVNKLFEKVNENGQREVFEEDIPYSDERDESTGDPEEIEIRPIICLCSLYGEYMRLSWAGKMTKSKDIIKSTTCEYISRSRFHGGIIVACTKNVFFKDIVATVGGNVIAIWKGEIQERPIAWKCMDYSLKGASWSKTVPSQIYVLSDKGTIDIWDFLERSDMPVRSQILTGTFSTGVYPHALFNKHIMSVADSTASLSIYSIPNIFVECDANEMDLIKKVFEREQKVRDEYVNWSDNYYENNPSTHVKYKPEKRTTFKDTKAEKVPKAAIEADDNAYGFHGEKISDKLPISLQRIAAGEQMWKKMQWEGVELAIQIRKALNKAELLFFEKPLRDVEAQKRSKRKKILDALENRNKIFEESVEILFPEAAPKNPPTPITKAMETVASSRQNILTEYENINKKFKSFVRHKPHKFFFSWDKEISQGKERCMHLDESANIFNKLNEKIKRQSEHPKKKVDVVELSQDKMEIKTEGQDEGSQEKPATPEKPPTPSPPPSPVLSDNDSDF